MIIRCLFLLAAFLVYLTDPVWAHQTKGLIGGFLSGFQHPFFGPDHVVAMVAVGIWGAVLGRPAIWALPVAFPLVMSFGGVLGVRGIPIPFVEFGISLSAIVLGIMVAFQVRPKIEIAVLITAAFGIFHGHAHGTELPNAANPLAYGSGFVISTGLLHVSGIALGLLQELKQGKRIMQACGVLIILTGIYFLLKNFGVM